MLLTTLVPEASGFPDPWAKPGLQGVYVGDGVMLTRNWLDQLMYVSSTDLIVTPHLLNLGYCEPHLTKVLMSLLQPGQVFVDIGANVGYYSVLGGRAVHPGGTVHAFEPNPAIHRLLADNLEVNGFAPSAIPHRLALSDRAGTAPLLVFEGRTAAATLRPVSAAYAEAFGARTGRTTHAVAVETLRLDDVLAAVPEVHLIKLDAEGHEPAILRGGTELLRRSPVGEAADGIRALPLRPRRGAGPSRAAAGPRLPALPHRGRWRDRRAYRRGAAGLRLLRHHGAAPRRLSAGL